MLLHPEGDKTTVRPQRNRPASHDAEIPTDETGNYAAFSPLIERPFGLKRGLSAFNRTPVWLVGVPKEAWNTPGNGGSLGMSIALYRR